jgi:hypothetical protein
MKVKLALGLALSLACISAAESPSNFQTISGGPVEGDSIALAAYDNALARCLPEAQTPPLGSQQATSLRYNAALRACLYRQGFIDRGAHAYPATLYFGHFLDR